MAVQTKVVTCRAPPTITVSSTVSSRAPKRLSTRFSCCTCIFLPWYFHRRMKADGVRSHVLNMVVMISIAAIAVKGMVSGGVHGRAKLSGDLQRACHPLRLPDCQNASSQTAEHAVVIKVRHAF